LFRISKSPAAFCTCGYNESLLKIEGLFLKRQGFTLLELIATLMIISILAVMAIPRFINLDASAKSRAIDAAVSELNGREGLVWAEIKFSHTGYDMVTGDSDVWEIMKNDSTDSHPELGELYLWTGEPTRSGGTLSFRGSDQVPLSRNISTMGAPARWSR